MLLLASDAVYVFTGQGEHSVAELESEYRPKTQGEQLDTPIAAPYIPAGHSVHVEVPALSANFPNGQE